MSLLRFRAPPRVVPPSDPGYPPGLCALPTPPPIRVAGALVSGACAVAVVGTRRADREAEAFTEAFAADLAAAGAVVVSGGARGIDTAAHRGALSVGGVTWAVLATGLDEAYPPENAPLFEEIAERGALVTEIFDQVVPRKGRFHSRNRLVAAIADVVVVVQAPERSGALSTARFAERYGKRLHIVPAAPWDPLGEGGLGLLARGAKVCTRAEDVLSLAGSGPPRRARSPGGRSTKNHAISTLDDVQGAVLGALSSRPRHVDELVRKANLPIEDVQHALLGLILMGLAEDKGGGRFVAATIRSPRS